MLVVYCRTGLLACIAHPLLQCSPAALMDALQALVLAAAPASCASSSAAGSTTTVAGFRTPSEPDGWPLSSGTKRRRLVSKVKDELIDLSTPVKVKVKDEHAYDDPDELGLSSVVKVEEEVGEKIQTCNGCARIKGSSVCFVNMDELVQWPPGSGGRGLWCRDCHTTWRTHFSATHTLLLFSKWIRVESNFRDFDAALVAYLSLRAEGGQDRRITSAMILERITMLRWLSGLLGWQLAPFRSRRWTRLGRRVDFCRLLRMISQLSTRSHFAPSRRRMGFF